MIQSNRDTATALPRDAETFNPASVSGSVGGPVTDNAVPVIDGYKISSCIGAGGMGTVWRANQLSTRREVALKLMSLSIARSPSACARFDREVELAARLEHPNIARVYDSGLHQGIYFYAMELIEGEPLDLYVATHQCTRVEILELMRSVCLAVQHAHQRGVIHRDLKPSNILVSKDGQPHVVDFGLAKAMLTDDSSVTNGSGAPAHPLSIEGDIAGTPQYMSPEQAAGRVSEVDTRSDVYSLGVILYQLLIGSPPHEMSGTSYQVMRRIVEEDPRRPRSVTRTIDRELEAVLLKALARRPDQRYMSAGDFGQDLGNYLNGEPLTARRPTLSYFAFKRILKRRGLVSSVATFVLAVSTFAGWLYFRPAKVELRTLPKGADVFVDGVKQNCCTPTSFTMSYGKHHVRCKPPDGYVEQSFDVGVKWGEALGLHPVVFAPNFQVILLNTSPPGAHIEVRRAGTSETVASLFTPAYINRLPVGRYDVAIAKEGYKPLAEHVDVWGSADPLPIERELTKLP